MHIKHRFVDLLCLTWLSMFASVQAQSVREIAFVLKVAGEASLQKNDGAWTPLKKGIRLSHQDRIRTGVDGLVSIVFLDDKTLLKIRANSNVQMNGEKTAKGIMKKLFMEMGEVWTQTKPGGGGFRLETPSGVAAVKGTEFYGIRTEDGEFIIIGIHGLVEMFNELGSILVGKGQTGKIATGGKPFLSLTEIDPTWAAGEDGEEVQIEFKNDAGEIKTLRIRMKAK